ncbi:MAG: phosphoribosylamine--glycine ligase [Candidatus Sungbacteria bacterium]|uniref:Phosphoribosylamine--glycine ligase n=1 Tax=Candidatus Sungiibacteriota bacterium TaxID=2750080 RepID=A0A9D6LSF3_9BACT|nr:phosphoribosylamine--glycine ligase [Candidatus Sungbacteria bacterium]
MTHSVLIIGGGGREHALACKLQQSPNVERIFILPGNAGTGMIGENVEIGIKNHAKIVEFVKENNIDLVVVGPDDPLADSMVDDLEAAGISIFGPTKAAAEIEWSKVFAKEFMQAEGIPTAEFQVFSDQKEANEYVKRQNFPVVIKASGLARGKGVIIAKNLLEAEKAIQDLMEHKIFGEAGKEIVIEEFLRGDEISIHVFCDGKNIAMFPSAQDHKQIFDNDEGPNTGGMGTITPVPWVNKTLMDQIKRTIVLPTIRGLEKRGRKFVGVLYPGLMITNHGPKVIEFNARFGDPEAQSYMRVLKTDLFEILSACVEARLDQIKIEWTYESACCVVLASGGYPGEYKKGISIDGLETTSSDAIIFHAGTKMQDGAIVTNGGRVLGVTATGKDLSSALGKAYARIKMIRFGGMQYRRDIGAKSSGK